MDALEKELDGRKKNIKREVTILFKANMKFTDWDIPEVDDTRAGEMIVDIMREALNEIEQDIKDGKYENY
jgi:hypothetical protein